MDQKDDRRPPQSLDELDLFGANRPRTKRTRQTAPAGSVQKLIGLYRQLYEQQFHEPPIVLKGDGTILGGLVRQFGLEKVERRLRAFMALTEAFVRDDGYSISLFQRQWRRLVAAEVSAPTDVPDFESTQQYIKRIKQ